MPTPCTPTSSASRSSSSKVNAAFVDHLPRPLRRPRKRPLRLGVDLTLLPYYGQHSLESREIYRSQAKRGTNSFFAYATAYLVLQGQRFTLAVTPVMRSECLKEVLQELLLLVSKAGLKPGLLLLDRGFYGCDRAGARDYAAFLGFFFLEPS